ncbi:MAG: DUF4190 domain-containing protein [Mycobacteriales bacterium]
MSETPSSSPAPAGDSPYRNDVYGPTSTGPDYGLPAAGQANRLRWRMGPPGPRSGRLNVLAVLSLVCAFLFWPLGIVFGHLARRQIRRTGERGAGVALTGLIISYLCLAAAILVVSGLLRVTGTSG